MSDENLKVSFQSNNDIHTFLSDNGVVGNDEVKKNNSNIGKTTNSIFSGSIDKGKNFILPPEYVKMKVTESCTKGTISIDPMFTSMLHAGVPTGFLFSMATPQTTSPPPGFSIFDCGRYVFPRSNIQRNYNIEPELVCQDSSQPSPSIDNKTIPQSLNASKSKFFSRSFFL